VPFFSISGSEFIELFVGVGASRVRSLFEQAHKAKRAIIFIDEIDSIGKVRGVGLTGGHEEREQTLNQILAEMDGIESGEGIIVMGATNRPEHLDPALLRPGRFDRRIVLDLPDANDREAVLNIHCRQKPLAKDVKLREVAERTRDFPAPTSPTWSTKPHCWRQSAKKTKYSKPNSWNPSKKSCSDRRKRSHLLSKDEKKIAAYHESGHALVSSTLPEAEPVRKISIISRGMAAGYTLKTATEEKKLRTKNDFIAEIATLLGGMTAEILIFGQSSTGASNDLKVASKIARKMVKEYGMSPLGPIVFGEKEESAFLGQEFEGQRNYSEIIAAKIDDEIAKIIKEGQDAAARILNQKKDILEKISERLIEKETIEKEEYENLIGIVKK
jgi:membrane protease FtsH catalytic subunit (EC 3.4.24.-)